MRFVAGLGVGQAVLPPQPRPSLRTLRMLGFTGTDEVLSKYRARAGAAGADPLGTAYVPLTYAAGQILATEITPTNTKVGDKIDISITVKNTSDKPLQTMGPDPGFTYVQGQTYFTQQYASDPGKWRVGIGTARCEVRDFGRVRRRSA